MKNKCILVTGSAGFIGAHLCKKLLDSGHSVVGIDNFNDYYDITLKESRASLLDSEKEYTLYRYDIADKEKVIDVFTNHPIDTVINLAAQAGVRYSIQNPHVYIKSNIVGFLNILEACRDHPVKHLVYASSSSVYGANRKLPFSEKDNVDHPVSLYGATKKSNELMAFSYSHLYKIPTTGLRFFTVYGPWGRPDMAPIIFAKAIIKGEPIKIFNFGKMKRDFTYIDDITEGIVRTVWNPPVEGKAETDTIVNSAPYRIYNIGNNKSVDLLYFIDCIEKEVGKKAKREYMPLQAGDMIETYADIDTLERDTGFKPVTGIEEGIKKFVQWFKKYYKVAE